MADLISRDFIPPGAIGLSIVAGCHAGPSDLPPTIGWTFSVERLAEAGGEVLPASTSPATPPVAPVGAAPDAPEATALPQLPVPSSAPALLAPLPTATPSPSRGSGGGRGSAPVATPAPTPAPVGLAPCAAVLPNRGEVALLAGGTYGYADGPPNLAAFRAPHGVAFDRAGNLYVADTGNRCVRRVSLDGVVSTIAGAPDRDDFGEPYGIAVDAEDRIYVSDTLRHAVFAVASDGAVTLIAGGDAPGFADGPGADARFDDPRGLAVDGAGRLYVADLNNHRVRRLDPLDPTRPVVTLAGNGMVGAADGASDVATFTGPIGVAVGPDEAVVVADSGANAMRKIAADGSVTTLPGAGTPGDVDGPGMEAALRSPWAVAVDRQGNCYVVDGVQATRISRIDPSGAMTTVAGGPTPGFGNGTGDAARLMFAFALAANSCGRLLVTDGFSRIREVQ